MNNLRKATNIILIFILTSLLALNTYSLYDLYYYIDTYQFGTEVASWRYYSLHHFIITSAIEILVILAGILVPEFLLKNHTFLIRLIAIFIVLSMIFCL